MFQWRMVDWEIFEAAIAAVLSGSNPYLVGYQNHRLFNPPWVLLILFPLLMLNDQITPPVVWLVALSSMYLVGRHFRLSGLKMFFLLSSPMLLYSMGYGNIEWLPWLGLLMPTPLALIFLTIKPQATFGVIIVRLLRSWERQGLPGVLLAVLPTAVLILIWWVTWGFPRPPDDSSPGNIAFFPWTLIIGVPLLLMALRRRSVGLAALAAPFISPYVTFPTYLATQFMFPFWGWVGGWVVAAQYLLAYPK